MEELNLFQLILEQNKLAMAFRAILVVMDIVAIIDIKTVIAIKTFLAIKTIIHLSKIALGI